MGFFRKLKGLLKSILGSTPTRCGVCGKIFPKAKDARLCEDKIPDEAVRIGYEVTFFTRQAETRVVNDSNHVMLGIVTGIWVKEGDHGVLGFKILSGGATYRIPSGQIVQFKKKVA